MNVLTPRLTALDTRVLEAVDARPMRARAVAERVYGWAGWRCDCCGHEWRAGRRKPWRGMPDRRCWVMGGDPRCKGIARAMVLVTADELREVREVLHGLARFDLVVHARGGWWRRA